MSRLNLTAALVLIAAWVLLTYVRPLGLGAVHLLLAAGVVLLMRWWGLKHGT